MLVVIFLVTQQSNLALSSSDERLINYIIVSSYPTKFDRYGMTFRTSTHNSILFGSIAN